MKIAKDKEDSYYVADDQWLIVANTEKQTDRVGVMSTCFLYPDEVTLKWKASQRNWNNTINRKGELL